MKIFDYMAQYEYEQLVLCQDEESGLKAIIAIHDTTLGPALGGCRIWPYETEEAAIEDALRLARGMTYKNAAAGLDLGGGKAVIIADSKKDKNPEMLRAFGRYVQSLNGRYITAEDVGASEEDMDIIHKETDFVTGISKTFGSGGNPSPVTAYGLYISIKASAAEAFGSNDLSNKKVAVQGVGNVAYELCRYLNEEGASLVVSDINQESVDRAVQDFGAEAVPADEIYDVDCDIFSPCALGAVINDDTIARLKAKVVAGSANNQLKSDEHGEILHQKGILYAPDYVINSGGVINVSDELIGYNEERAMEKVETIYDTLMTIFSISKQNNIPPAKAADQLAEDRIETARKSRYPFFPNQQHILSGRM